MRHYEVVFLVHPDRSDQVQPMIQRYAQIIESNDGAIHRLEQHSRQLAYPIQKVRKAIYVLMNIECNQATQEALEESFVFNDAVIRHAFFKQTHAIKEPSIFTKENKDNKDRKREPSGPRSTPTVATVVKTTDEVPVAETKADAVEEVTEESQGE